MSKKNIKVEPLLGIVPVVMVSCGDFLNSNISTIAWTGMISSNPAITYISLRKSRFSYDIIKDKKEFCINLVNKDLKYEVDYCGVNSGKDINKFKELKLTKEKASIINCPMIKESPISLECKVKEIKEIGSHDMIIAEIVSINADEKYLDEKGNIDLEKCNIITYGKKKYFETGNSIGKFGFSKK